MNHSLIYAGIGSRETPSEWLTRMEDYAFKLGKLGWCLRSGRARGADRAFEQGALRAQGPCDLFDTQPTSIITPAMFQLAGSLHPRWISLPPEHQKLHARNTAQILGSDLNTPVQFVLCWTPDGLEREAHRTPDSGGTATAICLADRWNIPVFNLANSHRARDFELHIRNHYRRYHPDGTSPQTPRHNKPWIFVFGSNEAGRHGKGAALEARLRWGAQPGIGRGLCGSSYAIATKNARLEPLSESLIEEQILECLDFMTQHSQWNFWITRVGCQLAGHCDSRIAPLWKSAPKNASFPEPWMPFLKPPIIVPRTPHELRDLFGFRRDLTPNSSPSYSIPNL